MVRGLSKDGRTIVVVALAYALLVVAWSLVIPYDRGPDERTHFFLLEYFYRFGRMPVPEVDPVEPLRGLLSNDVFTRDTFWYYGLPYLHTLGATLLSLAFAPLLPDGLGYLAPRAFNWLLAGIFMASLLEVARNQRLTRGQAIAAAAIVAMIPQVTFVFAYFNSDGFGLTACALALALLSRHLREPSRSGRLLAFGCACGLILCSKLYYYPALVFFAGLILAERFANPARRLVADAGWALLGMAVIAIPVLGTTYLQFGDISGMRGQAAYVALNRSEPTAMYGTCFLFCADGIINTTTLRWWLPITARSFFMTTGWMDTLLPGFVYKLFFYPLTLALLVWSAVVLLGVLRRMRQLWRTSLIPLAVIVLFWSMAVAVLVMNLLGQQNLLPQPQGRYMFVVLPFAALLLVLLRARAMRENSGVMARCTGPMIIGVAAAMLSVNLLSLGLTAQVNAKYLALGNHPGQNGLSTR